MDCGRISGCCPEPYRGSGIVSCWVTGQSSGGRRDAGDKAKTCFMIVHSTPEWSLHLQVAVRPQALKLSLNKGSWGSHRVSSDMSSGNARAMYMIFSIQLHATQSAGLKGKDSRDFSQMTAAQEVSPRIALCAQRRKHSFCINDGREKTRPN